MEGNNFFDEGHNFFNDQETFNNMNILLDHQFSPIPQSFSQFPQQQIISDGINAYTNQEMNISPSPPSYGQEMINKNSSSPSQFISFENPIIVPSAPTIQSNFYDPQENQEYYDQTHVLNFSSLKANSDDIREINPKASGMGLNVPISNRAGQQGPVRNGPQAQEHIIAERKRREKLSQLFISLSKTMPGIKKLDKGSLLQHAIEYTKQLQERVDQLEKEQANNVNDLVVGTSSSGLHLKEINVNDPQEPLEIATEVKARFSNKDVLICIWCKKQKGFMSRIHSEIEKMGLNAVDIRIMPFANLTLYATILAKMSSEFQGTEKDIVSHLEKALAN